MSNIGIVAFPFGTPEDILSNRRIAEMASQKANECKIPVYAHCDLHFKDQMVVVKFNHAKVSTTLRMSRDTIQWARNLKLDELWLACAEPHLWRCRRDLNYAIDEANTSITINVCEGVHSYLENEWFCTDSTQPRTHSLKAWKIRERIIKSIPMFLYRYIGS